MKISSSQTDAIETHRPGGLTLTRAALDYCSLAPGERVLDAGCGYGATCSFLHEEAGFKVFGMDASAERIALATARSTGWGGVRARLPRLPFAPDAFKGIFCECVLSLVPDKPSCLDNFFELLQSGGHLVLTDLYLPGATPVSLHSPALTCLDGALNKTDLIRIIEQAGFKIRIWEDHTPLLKQMACEMVFKHGSLENFWNTLTGDVFHCGLGSRCRAGELKPGYCLIVADKVTE
ncbi:DVU_1556 family methyltransferase [Desulfobacter curvatus]|uniref:DVU_1556 family methyltransferase n=1 Tax=Desulfobacter curvatus TaxID=2290 RepID=UPI000372F83A|nr:methyltransferase domain-containing protein [Desulfobacter curvatus]